MKWSEICIHTTQEAVEAITNILHEAGSSGVVIEDPLDLVKDWPQEFSEVYDLNPSDYPEEGVNIKAYLPVNSFLGETVEEIKQSINNLFVYDIDLGDNTITISEVNEEEWATAWKKYYKPVRLTDHITITPTWEEYKPQFEGEKIIELDPGMAFGTGTHPTTVLCIQALEKYLKDSDHVLDVGTGTGVLSIAAAKLGVESVLAVDLDEVAVKSAKINVKLNHVQDKVSVKQNNLADGIDRQYDIVVANLLAEIVIRLAEDAYDKLTNGGILISSGIIKQKELEVRQCLEKVGFTLVEVIEQEDWVALIAKKGED
ncbi:50S ribosomal protein L11 methyltransferase [Terrilactibacillus sp. BCM23-1]|uniref:Ribosomal protein L11 methyltransferase n=1 Tax=Terrilactibacillus tamarindi TaxID=2599694 RepID=A0A6N8CQR8_9BACI|nr:50S ribosomal protein L11 methyltransferase [Terrilactibacillus tamarindi]MTT32504.1 50S ribosomal protein L11 methyltransferase [Terrilactibacillus tamarindi]